MACLTALAEDPGVHLLVFAVDIIPRSRLLEPYVEIALRVAREISTPFAVLANVAATADEAAGARLRDAGIPVLLGTEHGLAAIAHVLALPERQRRAVQLSATSPSESDPTVQDAAEFVAPDGQSQPVDEIASKAFLAGHQIPTVDERVVLSATEAGQAARSLGWPIVLKTAMPGVMHKSDQGGVILNVGSVAAATRVYRTLRGRCGPRVVVQRQIERTHAHELYLGMTNSADWGPVVSIGFGGIDIETTRDTVSFLSPVGADEALRLLRRLRGYPLLLGTRGRQPVDLAVLAETIATFSRVCDAYRESVQAIDVNPLIVGPDGVVAVDATVIPEPTTILSR